MSKLRIPRQNVANAFAPVVYAQLGAILKPLLDKWNTEITLGGEARIGLVRARNDVQSIIDAIKKRS